MFESKLEQKTMARTDESSSAACPSAFFHAPKPRKTTLEEGYQLTAALESYDCLKQMRQVLEQGISLQNSKSESLLKNSLIGCCAQMMEKFKRFDNGLNPFSADMARKFRNTCYHAPELFTQPNSLEKLIAMALELVEYATANPKSSVSFSKPKTDVISSELWHTIQNHVFNPTITLEDCRQQLSLGSAELSEIQELPNHNDLMIQKAIEFIIAKLGSFAAKMREMYPHEYAKGYQETYGDFIPQKARNSTWRIH